MLKNSKLKRVRKIASNVADKAAFVIVWSSVVAAIYLTVLSKRKKGFYNEKDKSNK